ncbi:M3 family oligoendopeptidase [Roseibium denhamense]|uniref:Oligoendopeptidase F n=1 Tax=Roseibium denhamense TaxID=76305 RepID=A0ABY1NL93_9HYPH|nr:M3 family oligoendopeptidase [Roseibium denhamense]MTI06820.1 M3 family oligoendopeptidase [Roseibium denhamense]SMP11622.1 oligoendopeptidase F [Roseibium denhamense]
MPRNQPVYSPKTAAAEDLGSLPEWDLTDLYAGMDSDQVKGDLSEALSRAVTFETSYKGRLEQLASENVFGLTTAIRAYEDLEDLMGRLISFAGLVYAGNTSDPATQKFYGDVQEQITTASTHLLFFTLEMNRIDDAVMDQAMEDAGLSHYRPWITDLRKGKPYQLEDRVEQLFHEKSVTGSGAWNRLFDETMTSLSFQVDGQDLGIEPTLNMLQDPSGDVRKAAFDALQSTFSRQLPTFTLITNTLAKDKEVSDRWRKFADIADDRHLSNRVEREVVDALVLAVREAYPRLSHRYYKMKAKWLGMEQLNAWDRNAPLPDADTRIIPWTEAKDTVLAAYSRFSPDMAEIANRFFERGWIDAPARTGKAPGAFAHPTVPSSHPYVLLNYQGKIRDVMTLAHELGHGVHQVLAGANGPLMAPTPLTLAETASVFGEMLTFKSLLEKADNPEKKKNMLASKAEDMLNTVVRQIAFYTFERKVHTERRNGELTADKIGELWMSVQSESLGPAVKLNDGYETFWTYIPHFIHSPFYVYAYAFGDCLVNSLYAVYEQADAGFQDKYFDLLKAGGTKHHSELLAPFGLSAAEPDFWRKGLAVIEGLIDELEQLDRH